MSLLAVQGGATGSGTVTLLAPITNTDRTLTLPDATGTVLTTATAGVPVNGPAFSAYRNADQTGISASTWTKIQYNIETFDTNSCYDSTTNYRFTPVVAGYYQVSVSGALNGNATYTYFSVYKNGSAIATTPYNGSGGVGGVAVCLTYMNGTTDYVEGYIFRDGTANLVGGASGGYTLFQAAMVRAA